MPEARGSYAPPLPDAKLAEYDALADACPDRKSGEVMKNLVRMLRVFRETPDSTRPARPHAVDGVRFVPLDGAGDAPITDPALASGEVKRIWDHVPWKEEIQVWQGWFGDLDKDANDRNGAKLHQWYAAVAAAVTAKHFPEPGSAERTKAALRTAGEWLALAPDLGPRVDELRAKLNTCNAEINAAFRAKKYDGIPRPTLEPTPTRDAAHHLLWFAVELYLDREPITQDKLPTHLRPAS